MGHSSLVTRQDVILPTLSIIICVYNEAVSALPVIEKVRSIALSAGWSKDIVVVDNCSTDGTREQLQALTYPDVRVIYHERNGQGRVGAHRASAKHAANLRDSRRGL